jgi:7,8-dihydroneopterin aldolase/epimerase/oxygenase
MTDRLTIRKIRAYGYTGFLPEETKLGQWFEVDLIFQLDLSRSARTDEIGDTLDYREAIGCVKTIIQTQPFKLVERLTGAIAEALLALPLPFESVTVRLTKLTPPIPDFDGEITIELSRSRHSVRV